MRACCHDLLRRKLEFCNFFCANNANFNFDWRFFFADSPCSSRLPDRHLMNRTLTYASLHARDALRSNVRSSICWSCSVTQNHPQRIQHRIVQPLKYTPVRSVRYLSTKQTRKEKYISKKNPNVFPPLEGECPVEVPRSRDSIRAQEKEKERNLRVTTEQARLTTIADQLKKSATEKEARRKRTLISESKLPTPEQAGIYSSSNSLFKSNLTFSVRLPPRKRETKKPSTGRPTTKKRDKSIHIPADAILKNCTYQLHIN